MTQLSQSSSFRGRGAHPLLLSLAIGGILACGAGVARAETPPAKRLGRAEAPFATGDSPRPICDVARDARTRNSPAAPGLEAQCRAVTPLAATTGTATMRGRKLFDMEDRAIIIVGGKQSTAGELRRSLLAEIARKAGPSKTVKGGARKLDLVALNVADNGMGVVPLAQKVTAAQANTRAAQFTLAAHTPPTLSTYSQSARPAILDPSTEVTAVGKPTRSAVLDDFNCADKGPPRIIQVTGKLRPGGHVSVVGRCFGERPGRVEMIGQFPDGKLLLPFLAWDKAGIDVEVPATIRGAADHAVAVTVVTVDGKASAAIQANFIAARERVEVPARLWSPAADFELAATVETLNTETGLSASNPAKSGQTSRSLRVNPLCTLDDMDTIVLSGGVGQVNGWDQGHANDAAVTIAWEGTCVDTTTTTHYHYVIGVAGDDISVASACRVAFQTRAWAYCPVGIAP